MGFYNTLVIHNRKCPNCGCNREIIAQMHFACSANGPFIFKQYDVDGEVNWFSKDDQNFIDPDSTSQTTIKIKNEIYEECCYAKCSNCESNLYAVVRIEFLKIKKILRIGLEKNWPRRFGR